MKSLLSFFAGRRVLFAFFALTSAVALLGTLRLSVFMFDPSQTSFSMLPGAPFIRRHSCLSAYVVAAAEVGKPSARIYDPAVYKPHQGDAPRRIELGNFDQDQYEYPPPFLLLPKALLLVSDSFAVLRALWFVLVVSAVLCSLALTAAWIGGREGLATALLIPAVWIAFPNLLTLQTGNVQLVVFAMTILAMVAFDRGRMAAGGALLAFAIGTKLYPGVLLLFLLAQRRFREALFTLGFGAAYCAATLAVAGVAPFDEFFTFQLPRLLSGEAFAFFKEHLESKATNNSIFGLPYKLELVGLLRDPDRIAPLVSRLYMAAVLVTTLLLARRVPRAPAASSGERATRGMLWMAILNLVSVGAPFAPPYALLGSVWMLTLWAPLGRSFWKTAVLFAAGWISLTVIFPKPMSLLLVTGFLAPLANLGINIAALRFALRRRPEPALSERGPEDEPAPA